MSDNISNVDFANKKPRKTLLQKSGFSACFHKHFLVDVENRKVTCSKCGKIIDPFDAIVELADHQRTLYENAEQLSEMRKEINTIMSQWKFSLKEKKRITDAGARGRHIGVAKLQEEMKGG